MRRSGIRRSPDSWSGRHTNPQCVWCVRDTLRVIWGQNGAEWEHWWHTKERLSGTRRTGMCQECQLTWSPHPPWLQQALSAANSLHAADPPTQDQMTLRHLVLRCLKLVSMRQLLSLRSQTTPPYSWTTISPASPLQFASYGPPLPRPGRLCQKNLTN